MIMWNTRAESINAAPAAGWPGLADAPRSLKHDLALKEASSSQLADALSHLGFRTGSSWYSSCPRPRTRCAP